jgi:lipopolysaccharide assembly protein A
MKYVTGTLTVVLLVAVMIFSIQNREAIDVSFLHWSLSIPKIFLILGTYLLGMLSGWGAVELVKRALT